MRVRASLCITTTNKTQHTTSAQGGLWIIIIIVRTNISLSL